MTMKRFAALLLALALSLSLAVSASAEDKPVLTIAIQQHGNVEDWETNEQTLLLEELCGVDLQFVTYPSEMKSQLTMAITGGSELADIIFNNPGLDLLYQWALAGAVIPLNDYIANDAVYIKDAVERTGVDFFPFVTSPDGNIYTLPIYNQSLTNEAPDKIWIYQPWLEKLGLEAPNDAEELYQVLKAFKEQDPNGNGEADEIPMMSCTDEYPMGCFRAIMDMFQYISPKNYYYVDEGTLVWAPTTEGYREGLQYLRKLFDEGLIDPMSFTADKTQLRALVNAEVPVVGMTVGMVPLGTPNTDRIVEYAGVEPFKNKDGVRVTSFDPSLPYPQAMITSYCKDPALAFKFLDTLYRSDMSIINHWGIEGRDWEYAGPDDECAYANMGYSASFREINALWGTVQNVMWYQTGPWAREYAIASGRVLPNDPRTTGARAATIQWAYSENYPSDDIHVPTLIFTEEESDEVSMILADLNNYTYTSLANFCLNTEGMDVNNDDAWNAYLAQLDTIGLQQVLPTLQAVYDRMYK